MPAPRRLCWTAFLACSLFTLALTLGGCGGGSAPLQPVSGKVSYRGTPVPTGQIVFIPDASRGGSGPLAVGEIRADGTYTLKTGQAAGAAPGWYRITIASVGSHGSAAASPPYAIPQSLLPDRYRDPETSRLACEIKPRANTIDLDLE